MQIPVETIAAVQDGEQLLCVECYGDLSKVASPEAIITQEDLEKDEENMVFCDRCNRRLS